MDLASGEVSMCFYVFGACTLKQDTRQDEKYKFKGDFTQQFAAFKKWLESDRRKQTTRPTRLR